MKVWKRIQKLRKITRVQAFTVSAMILGVSLILIALDINPGDIVSYIFVLSLLTTGALFGSTKKKKKKG